jgi:hypothetical protein
MGRHGILGETGKAVRFPVGPQTRGLPFTMKVKERISQARGLLAAEIDQNISQPSLAARLTDVDAAEVAYRVMVQIASTIALEDVLGGYQTADASCPGDGAVLLPKDIKGPAAIGQVGRLPWAQQGIQIPVPVPPILVAVRLLDGAKAKCPHPFRCGAKGFRGQGKKGQSGGKRGHDAIYTETF